MTFSTNTLNNSSAAISDIEHQIAELQKQLTELQEQQQAIKSAEQQGLSAIAQYKQAIATIAVLNEPEMLREFLREMAAITMAVEPDEALQGDDSLEEQPTINDEPSDTISDEPSDDDLAEPTQESTQESTAITSKQRKLSDVIVEAVGDGLDNQYAWSKDDKAKVMRYKKAQLINFCEEHNITMPVNPNKSIICLTIARAGFTAENVCQWLEQN